MNDNTCYYCTHCGAHSFNEDTYNEFNGKCHYCNAELKKYDLKFVLEKYKSNNYKDLSYDDKIREQKNILKNLILNQADFDMALFKQRNAEEFNIDLDLVFDVNDPLISVECPYCHSNDTKKITATGRLISFGLFGFGSSKINGKQWHCNTCKSDF